MSVCCVGWMEHGLTYGRQVLTHGGVDAELQEGTRAMLDKYEGAFVTEWAPQAVVLAHPVRCSDYSCEVRR